MDRPLIFVVDDESKIRRLVAVNLESSGFDVMTADDGRRALEVLQHSDHKPDLIVLDVMMPGLDGLEVLKVIRQHSPVPVIADMSSDILSRPVDVSKYALIYGGAQKNLAPAGVTFVIVRDDMLQRVVRDLPSMVNVNTHVDNNSMFNTPPVFPIYVMNETLKWLKSIGGVEEIYRRNLEKANLLYDEIDRNSLFRPTAVKEDRSLMNICFVMAEGKEDLAPEFLEFAKSRGMVGIKGHRLVGGFRASCYNACPKESVEALIACMREFESLKK